MKKIKSLITVALLFIMLTGLSSCLSDDDKYWVVVGTYRSIDENEFYLEIEQDNKIEKMYPGDTQKLLHRDIEDGQRVYIYYDLLKEQQQGYDYNAKIYALINILTKDIIPITEATQDSIGHASIDIANGRISLDQEFIHIRFQYKYNQYSNVQHMLNMVIPANTDEDKDFITLEFRHNNFEDVGHNVAMGYVTFRLRNILDQTENKKGIRIKYNSINHGERILELPFDGIEPAQRYNQIGTTSIK